jgi:hypothetical protein
MMQKIEKGSSGWGDRGLTRENRGKLSYVGQNGDETYVLVLFKQNFDSHRKVVKY